MSTIALVKGEGTLPPRAQEDCRLLVRAAFLPRHRPARLTVPQIVCWYDPDTCQPRAIARIDARDHTQLSWQKQGDCSVTNIAGLRLSFSCQPASIPPALPVSRGQRTLHVALAAAHNGVWHDGYLAHLSAAGQVLSLLSVPDSACLCVPQNTVSARGIDPAAVALPSPAHYRRLCLRALIASVCRQQGLQGKLTLAIDDTSLAAMLCVVLLKSLHDIDIVAAPKLPPAWVRLWQNIGVRQVQAKPQLTLSFLSKLVPAAAVVQIAEDINSRAAVIPAKVVARSCSEFGEVSTHA